MTEGARSWWLILAARVVLFALAAAGSVYAVLGAGGAPAAGQRYRCPMHPDAMSAGPAACPICGMALVLRDPPRVGARGEEPPARVARAVRRRFTEVVRAPAWIDASGAVVAALYRDDLIGMAPGQPAQFFAASAPSLGVDAVLTAEPAIDPTGSAAPRPAGRAVGVPSPRDLASPIDWDAATVRARFRPAGAVSPGDEGSLVIPALPREMVAVPSSAIVATPDGPCLFVVDPATGREVRRAVRTGREHQGAIAVLGGVAEGDEVVIGDAFFVAAERALHPEAP